MDNMKELLLEIQKSVNGIKADLILMKYDIEQIDAKLSLRMNWATPLVICTHSHGLLMVERVIKYS